METRGKRETENQYLECRKRAAVYNEKLNSREITADLLGISTSTLTKYELGVTKCVPVDMVIMMSDLYKAPELRNWYCKTECPIGCRIPISTKVPELEKIAVRMANCLDEDRIRKFRKSLLKMAEDGKITRDEVNELREIMDGMDSITQVISELRMFAEKNNGGSHGFN